MDNQFVYYLEKNHIFRREISEDGERLSDPTDFGYYQLTTELFLDKRVETLRKYLHSYDDRDAYQITRLYSDGKQGMGSSCHSCNGWGCRRLRSRFFLSSMRRYYLVVETESVILSLKSFSNCFTTMNATL